MTSSTARVGRGRLVRLVVPLTAALTLFGLLPTAVSTAAAAAARPLTAQVDPGLRTGGPEPRPVIVTARSGDPTDAARAVTAAGAAVDSRLELVGGVSAVVTGGQLSTVSADPRVLAVTADRVGRFAGAYDELTNRLTLSSALAPTTTSPLAPTDATNSLVTPPATTAPPTPAAAPLPTSTDDTVSPFLRSTGATDAWDRGIYGRGVGVAVIDTGVASHPDLAGRLVHGPDLSGEGSIVDSFGHGTVMAGLVAGNGNASATRKQRGYSGVAPQAKIVSVKVAGRNASVDVSTVLQAMHWVSVYRQQFNIRVLNLSWGVPSTQDPTVDPLNYAVEKLWREGIVVVTAAGNRGPRPGTIIKPADDPLVITAGAYDDRYRDESAAAVPEWSSRGPTAAGLSKPDVVAPGRRLVAARSFGSWVEQSFPAALLGAHYIRGSGTSESAAVVSGLAALLISKRPSLTPDQVKHLLRSTAKPLYGGSAFDQGNGRVRLDRALEANPERAPVQQPVATGTGSIEASRGGMHVAATCNGERVVISGEQDVHCEPWNGTTWTGTTWTGDSWTGTTWTADSWTGTTWTGTTWTGGSWTGGAWLGLQPWTGTTWTGTTWTGDLWQGTTWTGTTWTGTTWTGTTWTDQEFEFQTAFWGDRPGFWEDVPGEASEPLPVDTTLILGGLLR